MCRGVYPAKFNKFRIGIFLDADTEEERTGLFCETEFNLSSLDQTVGRCYELTSKDQKLKVRRLIPEEKSPAGQFFELFRPFLQDLVRNGIIGNQQGEAQLTMLRTLLIRQGIQPPTPKTGEYLEHPEDPDELI